MHEELLKVLNQIEDPELGIGIVDLGLVYRADWTETGIDVALTMTSPSCPFGDALVAQADAALRRQFRDRSAIRVELAQGPPWTPDRMNDQARQKLGWSAPTTAPPGPGFGRGRVFGFWKQ
jgi:metal-sulfur cluster biosynthetic enzyme